MSAQPVEIVPYDHDRHGDGPKRVVIESWKPYGYEFSRRTTPTSFGPTRRTPSGSW